MLLNRKRAEQKMVEHNIRALVSTSPANVFYVSDLCPYGRCIALLPEDRNIEPAVIAPISGPTPIVLMSVPWISDVRYYGEFYTMTRWAKEPLTSAERKLVEAQESWERTKEADPNKILIKLLMERGITKGRIGVDETYLPSDSPFWHEIKNELPDITAVRARDILREIRLVKSEEEVRRIQEAIRITEKAWETALEEAKQGISEWEFATIYEHTVLSERGRIVSKLGMYGAPIGFGRRTAFVDISLPSDYRLAKGDLIRLDGGCSYMGYRCDIGRSAVLGVPSEKLKKYYEAMFQGEQLAIDMAKPGVKASAIFNAAVEKVRRSGIPHYARHNTGHGWGVEGYDPPTIGPKDDTQLEEGMVICFETPYYEVGWGGPIIEDAVVISKNGARFLSKFSRELYAISG